MATKFTFSKAEKLTEKKIIDNLFKSDLSFKSYPLRAIMLEIDTTLWQSHFKVLFAVGLKTSKSAVVRNKYKRLLRESYRLNKHTLQTLNEKNYAIAFFIMGKEEFSFDIISNSMVKILGKIQTHIQK